MKPVNHSRMFWWIAGLIVGFSLHGGDVQADAITCGSAQRTATLTAASSCVTGPGNPQAGDIRAAYSGELWIPAGNLSDRNGTNDLLTVTVTSGQWGGSNASGQWGISPTFWSTYGEAVISLHVGNGGGDPDHWAWLLTPSTLSGSWAYSRLAGGGGGLSNLRLWGRGEARPVSVPEPSATLLLGVALAGLLGYGWQQRRMNYLSAGTHQ